MHEARKTNSSHILKAAQQNLRPFKQVSPSQQAQSLISILNVLEKNTYTHSGYSRLQLYEASKHIDHIQKAKMSIHTIEVRPVYDSI